MINLTKLIGAKATISEIIKKDVDEKKFPTCILAVIKNLWSSGI
ncbi:MAG: hypothetical protein AB1567_00120 [bacterium]